MSLSFWINLAVCIVSFLPAFMDHGETLREIRAQGFKTASDRTTLWLRLKLFLLWGIPAALLFATVISGFESLRADDELQTVKSENATLKSDVKALDLKSVRRINNKQKEAFIELLKDQWKVPVRICVLDPDYETETFANHIRDILDAAGYAVTNGNGITRITGLQYNSPIHDPGGVLPLGFVFYGEPEKNIDWGDFQVTFTGDDTVYTIRPNKTSSVPAVLDQAFQKIGIKPGAGAMTNFPSILNAGDWCIYVPRRF